MELGALVYGNSDDPTKKAGMAALKFLSDSMNVPSLSIKAWLVTVVLQNNTNQSGFNRPRRNIHTMGEVRLATSRLTTSHSQRLNRGKALGTGCCEWLWSIGTVAKQDAPSYYYLPLAPRVSLPPPLQSAVQFCISIDRSPLKYNNTGSCAGASVVKWQRGLKWYLCLFLVQSGTLLKACIRLEIEIEIRLDFDQSKQNSLNLRLVFFLLIG